MNDKPNFASILDEAPNEVVLPPAMPNGTYNFIVKGWEDGRIKYHRYSRARKAKGEKPAKPQAVDISQVMMKLTKPKTEVKITRRF